MKSIYALLAVGLINTAPLAAQPDILDLKHIKSMPLFVTKSEHYIDFTPQRNYDKYMISIVGDGGFSHQFESETPSINISDIHLPYDGTYSYEIRAIKHIADNIKDTINNGRAEDAVGKLSIVDVSNGQFTTQNFNIQVTLDEKEPPLKVVKKPAQQMSLFNNLKGDK